MDFDYTSSVRDRDRALDKARNEDLEFGECGMDRMGRSHDPNSMCNNQGFDPDIGDIYCKVQRIRDLEMQKEEYEWLPSMLDYFWQNGIGSKGVEFLRSTCFIQSYE